MKILYIAKHNSGDNDDEGAIRFALGRLGHEVTCFNEKAIGQAVSWSHSNRVDFALFHKIEDFGAVSKVNAPKVFWYFDLITHQDFTLQGRSDTRQRWLRRALEVFDIGFMTDGDAVLRHPEKLYHLMQGADQRVIGRGKATTKAKSLGAKLLFTGTTIHGHARYEFCRQMEQVYGSDFKIIGNPRQRRYHGRDMADIIASSMIMIAPQGPVTDLYWSNRVYLTLGFGGFLLHPRCKLLETHFKDGSEILYYDNIDQLHRLIEMFSDPLMENERMEIPGRGIQRVVGEHLYRHRCSKMIDIITERFANVSSK